MKPFLRVLITIVCILLAIAIFALAFLGLGYKLYKYERWQPSRSEMLSDEQLLSLINGEGGITDEAYDTIFRQTGLTRLGTERVLEGSYPEDILNYRDSFFRDYTLVNDEFALFCNQISISRPAKMVPLQDGDIIVTSSTNFSMWDVGHATIVLDASRDLLLEALNPEEGSTITDSYDFMTRADFIVLRPKLDGDTISSIIDYTMDNLLGLSYDPTVGVFSPKNPSELTKTQCAHIIWYAFMHFGIDIDSNGGAVVTPKDIANSDLFDIVQVFGTAPSA